MATPPVRLGIVGCGNIVTAHLHAFATLRDHGFDAFRVAALCDSRVESAEMFRLRGEGPLQRQPIGLPWEESPIYVSDFQDDGLPDVCSDWREVAESSDVDAVFILAPIFLHHQIALECLRAGKHVLVEKPLAVSVRAGRQMVEEARAAGLILGVAENLRYMEPLRIIKFALDSGRIGAMQFMVSAGILAEEPWTGGPDGVRDRTPWRHRRVEGGGGFTIDAGVHFFNYLRYLCGEIDEISAVTYQKDPRRYLRDASGAVLEMVESDVDDAFFAHLKFESGAIGSVAQGVAARGSEVALEGDAAFYGSNGCLKGDVLHFEDAPSVTARAVYESDAPDDLKDCWFPRGVTDAYALEQLAFFDAIETGRSMETSGEEGLRDLACSFAVLESAHSKHRVRVGDVLSGHVHAYQDAIDEHWGLS